jgi:competence protein ComEA
MPWLYRLQTRAGLTGPEGTAAVVLVLALAGGLAAQRRQAAETPVAPDFYAAADAAFVAASQPVPAAGPLVAGASGPLPADSTAATADSAVTPADVWTVTPEAALSEADAAVTASAERSSGRKPPPVRTNLNTATAEQLQRLPRIGPALAGRILEYRRQHGGFRSAAELTEVRGIGDKTMERLAPWVFI